MKELCFEKLYTEFGVDSFIFMDTLAEMLPLPPKLQILPKRVNILDCVETQMFTFKTTWYSDMYCA